MSLNLITNLANKLMRDVKDKDRGVLYDIDDIRYCGDVFGQRNVWEIFDIFVNVVDDRSEFHWLAVFFGVIPGV